MSTQALTTALPNVAIIAHVDNGQTRINIVDPPGHISVTSPEVVTRARKTPRAEALAARPW